MVDTYDLFKKLGCGAQFDLKRFQEDAKKFQIIKEPSKTNKEEVRDALDFFGTRSKKPKPEETELKDFDKDRHNGNEDSIKKKKKRKRKQSNDDNSDNEDEDEENEIQLLNTSSVKKKKKKKMKDSEKKLTKQQKLDQHIEKISLFRKEHKIHANGSDIPDPVETFHDLKKNVLPQNNYIAGTQVAFHRTKLVSKDVYVKIQQRELLACAPTGSGKTLAFIVPLLCHLKEPKKQGFRAVVVSPTRELAQQIYREFNRLNSGLGFRIHVLTKAKASSNNFGPKSSNKFDILITTPNRLVHLLRREPSGIDLTNVEWLVLDEGDKLFEEGDAGFRDQVAEIYQACDNPGVRHALFSATLANNVEEWCKIHLDNVIRITVGARNSATDTIDQELLFVGQESGKLLAMRQIIQKGFQPPVLVFVQSKDRAKELFNELIYDGLNVDVIHSDRTQAQRENVVKCFRTGKIWILIATELMGRGIDFKGVNMVINYDFPPTAVSYIHRIGRTGRAGRKGNAITMFTEDDVVNLRSIANVMKSSGCEIPEWMLQLKKPDRRTQKKLAKAPVQRKSIKTLTKYDKERSSKKKQMIEMSKKGKEKKTEAIASENE